MSNNGSQLYDLVTEQVDSTNGKSSLHDFLYTVNMNGLVPTKPQQVTSLMAKNNMATREFLLDPANIFAVNVEYDLFIELNGIRVLVQFLSQPQLCSNWRFD